MHITLIRHLPTEWNKLKKLQGRQDIEITTITEEYQNSIEVNKNLLKAFAPFDIVLASTLRRTHQTAEIYGFTPEVEGLLDELDFGEFEGGPKKTLVKAYGDKWIESPRELVLGESLIDFEERVVSFLDKYHHFSNILVFGHGSWIRAIVSYHHHGDINKMNKMLIENNQCITLRF